jgi:polar amino acid transport system permease protein
MPKRKPRIRLHWLDAVVFAGLAAFAAYVYHRVDTVLRYNWNWSPIPAYFFRWDEQEGRYVANLLVQGLATSFRLAVFGIALAAVIGVVMGLCRTSDNLFLRMVSRSYVELVRNIPPLVFLFLFYYFFSSQIVPLLGIENVVRGASPAALAVIDALFGAPALFADFVSGLIVLALFEGAYVTEIVRAGIQSVGRAQWEGGASVGLTRFQVMRFVVMPQAVQRILPPLANQFITLIKDSSIVSLISIQELTFLSLEIAASTTRVFEVWITVAVMYFAICYACALLFARLERRALASRW